MEREIVVWIHDSLGVKQILFRRLLQEGEHVEIHTVHPILEAKEYSA